ncbi:MAG TPA: 50S ribosomal protein L11 methyltransferase [Rhizomicrobium sp.]|nr:50S ribosomal protein L11 methyltransferase [Rhizomicrobium sp.]
MDPSSFVSENTVLLAPPLVPEVRLHLAAEMLPLWRKTEEELEAMGVPPPYWAFAWAGGQALARYILDNPDEVRGKRVLDFGSGSGLVSIAAAKAGAAHVVAADVDDYAAAAIALNARANDVTVDVVTDDVIGSDGGWQTILCGDMCYERPLAEKLLVWLRARGGTRILLGDPKRSYFPQTGVSRLATYRVQTTRDLEDSEIRETGVFALEA